MGYIFIFIFVSLAFTVRTVEPSQFRSNLSARPTVISFIIDQCDKNRRHLVIQTKLKFLGQFQSYEPLENNSNQVKSGNQRYGTSCGSLTITKTTEIKNSKLLFLI